MLKKISKRFAKVIKDIKGEMFVDKAGWILIIVAVVAIILVAFTAFVGDEFLPAIFDRLMEML